MNTLINFLENNANKKTIFIGIILIVLFNTVFLPKFPKLFIDKEIAIENILDLKFSYSTETAYQIISELGAQGRKAYKYSEIFVDIPYAIIYGFIYAFIIIILLNINNIQNLKYLSLVPLFISFFDILENLGIITIINSYPEKKEMVSSMSSFFTSLKWIFAAITLTIIFTLLIRYLIVKISN